MKKDLIGKVLAVFGACCLGIAFIFWLGVPNNAQGALVGAISLTVGGLVMCAAGIIVFNTPGKGAKRRMAEYAAYPAREINDFKAELDCVRESFYADTNSKKNRVARISYPNFQPNYDYKIFESGKIYYAQLVQANNKLFKKASEVALPAVVIYSTDEYFERNPLALKKISDAVYENRHNNVLGNNYRCFFNVRLPDAVTDGKTVYMTTIMIYRDLLPLRYLSGTMLPVIADPEKSTAIFVIDPQYWTQDLIGNFVHGEI